MVRSWKLEPVFGTWCLAVLMTYEKKWGIVLGQMLGNSDDVDHPARRSMGRHVGAGAGLKMESFFLNGGCGRCTWLFIPHQFEVYLLLCLEHRHFTRVQIIRVDRLSIPNDNKQ